MGRNGSARAAQAELAPFRQFNRGDCGPQLVSAGRRRASSWNAIDHDALAVTPDLTLIGEFAQLASNCSPMTASTTLCVGTPRHTCVAAATSGRTARHDRRSDPSSDRTAQRHEDGAAGHWLPVDVQDADWFAAPTIGSGCRNRVWSLVSATSWRLHSRRRVGCP